MQISSGFVGVLKRALQPLVDLFHNIEEVAERTIKDVDAWDGAASNYADPQEYCAACLINANTAAGKTDKQDWDKGHCMLPVREPGDPKGTYVRLLKFPAEGRVLRGARGLDVGDKVRVRLASVDVAKGFIDFET